MAAPECEEQLYLASRPPGVYAVYGKHANPEPVMPKKTVTVNRAPVLTLWASVVAERLGYDMEEALTLGKALAGLNAQTKGRSLGIFKAPKAVEGKPKPKRGIGVTISVRSEWDRTGLPVVFRDEAGDPWTIGRSAGWP